MSNISVTNSRNSKTPQTLLKPVRVFDAQSSGRRDCVEDPTLTSNITKIVYISGAGGRGQFSSHLLHLELNYTNGTQHLYAFCQSLTSITPCCLDGHMAKYSGKVHLKNLGLEPNSTPQNQLVR